MFRISSLLKDSSCTVWYVMFLIEVQSIALTSYVPARGGDDLENDRDDLVCCSGITAELLLSLRTTRLCLGLFVDYIPNSLKSPIMLCCI